MMVVIWRLHHHNEVADIKIFRGALGMMETEGILPLVSRSSIILKKKVM